MERFVLPQGPRERSKHLDLPFPDLRPSLFFTPILIASFFPPSQLKQIFDRKRTPKKRHFQSSLSSLLIHCRSSVFEALDLFRKNNQAFRGKTYLREVGFIAYQEFKGSIAAGRRVHPRVELCGNSHGPRRKKTMNLSIAPIGSARLNTESSPLDPTFL